ncbi:MAG TPA: hypothetical protein VI259_17935 [Gemmatimonadaceae bacterium]
MADRDWDKELAKIDKQLASISDEALVGKPAAQGAGPAGAKAPAGKALGPTRAPVAALPSGEPRVERETRGWQVYLRLLLSVAAGIALIIWPYDTRCGTGLFGYLGATAIVTASGIWSGVWTWRHRAPRAHTVSLLLILWGMVLGSIQVLPRIGYGKPDPQHPATWACTNDIPK